MRRKDNRDGADFRKGFNEEQGRMAADSAKRGVSSADMLRRDFSWINYFKSMHPNWEFVRNDAAPWTPLPKPLCDAKVALLTTAGVYVRGQKPFNIAPGMVSEELWRQKFKSRGDWSYREIPRDVEARDLKIAHPELDHHDADDDINCVFPLERFRELVYENYIGDLARVHYGLMGYVPEHWLFFESTVPEIISKMISEQVDVAFITAGDPLSHQTAALIQREIERGGISTVSVSLCPDITESVRVPRAVAVRFPLGNVLGARFDETMQMRIIKDALELLVSATAPGKIVDLPYEWIQED